MQQNNFYKDFEYDFLQRISSFKGVHIRQYSAIQVILLMILLFEKHNHGITVAWINLKHRVEWKQKYHASLF